jgi:hypothetical protein
MVKNTISILESNKNELLNLKEIISRNFKESNVLAFNYYKDLVDYYDFNEVSDVVSSDIIIFGTNGTKWGDTMLLKIKDYHTKILYKNIDPVDYDADDLHYPVEFCLKNKIYFVNSKSSFYNLTETVERILKLKERLK